MEKKKKMCQKSAFLVVPDFGYPQSRGPPWKLAHWKCCPICFWWLLYMLGLCHFIFATFSNEKVFTVTANVTVTVVPLEFWKLTEIRKNIFLTFFSKRLIFFFKTYIKEYVLGLIFMIFKIIFLFFFNFLRSFEKKISDFLKKYDQPWVQLFRPPGAKNHIFRIFPSICSTCILMEKSENYHFLLQGAWTIVLKVNFPKTWFLTNWHFH